MNWTPLQLALRELRAIYRDPRALGAMAAIGVVAGLAGPFGTFEQLPQGLRIVYWSIIAFTTYGAGTLAGRLVAHLLPAALPTALGVLLSALGAAVPVTIIVMVLNGVFLVGTPGMPTALTLYFYAFVVSVAVIWLVEVMLPSLRGKPQGIEDAPPPILKRVPAHLRGQLVRLGTADHYVEVHTDKGMALVLMRFSDALGEVGTTPGVRTHRGHWVALDAVRGLARSDGRPVVELINGETLPVSRGQLAAVRAAIKEGQ